MPEKIYDALIVGTGPAGMFAALELIKLKPELKILMSEKGSKRDFIRDRANRTSGFRGAGAFSDGKLTLSSKVGGQLLDILGEEKFNELMNYVDSRYVEFGGNNPLSSANKINRKRSNNFWDFLNSVNLSISGWLMVRLSYNFRLKLE